MAFSIDEFKSNFLGGARGNKFLVNVPFLPTKFTKFLIQSTTIPGSDIEEVTVKYMGTTVKLAGERTWGDWSVTAYLDEDYAGVNELQTWQEIMRKSNSGEGANTHTAYKKEAFVSQLSQDGSEIARFKLEGMFPKSIGAITLGADATEVSTLEVTFAFDDMLREM